MMSLLRILVLLICVYGAIAAMVFLGQRGLLYHPTHRPMNSIMDPWIVADENWGMVRPTENPSGVWLVLHGNGGQAAHRDYLLEQVPDDVAVYVLEYPGYGNRLGRTNEENINAAAVAAWQRLRSIHPELPIGVIGESIGSGPGAWLAQQDAPPEKIVLLVPFDQLYRVAAERFWWLPVKVLMRDQWDNVAALRDYRGEIEIYAAADDRIIPVERAKALASAYPQARFEMMLGGHNSWQWDERFELPARSDVAAELPASVQ